MLWQQLPQALRELQETTRDEWIADAWKYAFYETGVVPVEFGEDGCDDALKEHVEANYTAHFDGCTWHPKPQITVCVDATACQDWEVCRDKGPKVFLKSERGTTKAFDAKSKAVLAIGPEGNQRVFYTFEIEECE